MAKMTKAQKIRKILDEGHIDPRHVLSLEVCIDRLNEGLPLTQRGIILCGYYSEELISIRNRNVWAARKGEYVPHEDMRGKQPKSKATRLKIAAAQKARHERKRLEKEAAKAKV